jgi:hypothetical protein
VVADLGTRVIVDNRCLLSDGFLTTEQCTACHQAPGVSGDDAVQRRCDHVPRGPIAGVTGAGSSRAVELNLTFAFLMNAAMHSHQIE